MLKKLGQKYFSEVTMKYLFNLVQENPDTWIFYRKSSEVTDCANTEELRKFT